MICPNLSNPQVKQEFEELQDAVGSDLAYLVWNRNNGFHLDKTSDGKESRLFKDLLTVSKDRKQALTIKAKTLTDSFKLWFHNSKVVDENGEPLLVYHGGRKEDIREFKGHYRENEPKHSGYYFTDSLSYAVNYMPRTGDIYPVFLSIQSPKELEEVEHDYVNDVFKTDKFVDGVIGTDSGTNKTAFVTRFNRQIKSVFNKGSFDLSNADIYDNEPELSKIFDNPVKDVILENFESTFPDLSYLNETQRDIMARLAYNNRIQLTCSI
jgi:hypothetical protein